jgi:UDP-N-acetylmuramoyl-tripeptide--D-alanyl-D-alanine ligase
MTWALALACAVAAVPAGLRWLRVSQREHYLAPAASIFAWRWWLSSGLNGAMGLAILAGVVGAVWSPWPVLLVAAAQVGPVGLRVRGTTSPLAWTTRLKRLAGLTGLLTLAPMVVGAIVGSALLLALPVALLPALVDLAAAALAPVERALGQKWVDRAAAKLASIGPTVIAITGSYGKTTTKGYVTHLLGGSRRVVATPASFNNRMGLARAINEGLVPGTEVFVAEMGTYGPGEIAEMCEWVTPAVGVIVSVGPVHLERFGSEETIAAAKAEILDRAGSGVVCVDNPLLARVAEGRKGKVPIIEVSVGDRGRVRVTPEGVILDGVTVAPTPEGSYPENLGAAVGACLALGVPTEDWAPRLDGLPTPPHRQTVSVSESGFAIIDDTFNSNPAGARRALGLLASTGTGVRAVVTPGMVEMGRRQGPENEALAAGAAGVADHLVVVGATNRRALVRGASGGRASVSVVATRGQAVRWARANLGPGDAVLYENDLPDHYP